MGVEDSEIMVECIDDLLQVLYLEDQRVIAGLMDPDSLRLSNELSYRMLRQEIDDSCKKTLEFMRDNLGLSFGGIYINNEIDTGAQIDRETGAVMPAHWDDVERSWCSVSGPQLYVEESLSRVVHKLRSGDKDAYGITVFEKPEFSVQDIAVIKDAVRRLSAYVGGVAEKYPLREQVITDDMTGLFNKRKLRRDYLAAVRGWQHHSLDFALAFADLDRFKDVNTFYGHDYGDMVLETVADIMRDVLEEEKLSSQVSVYRFGGEEFVLIYPGASSETLYTVTDKITSKIRAHEFPDGEDGRRAREITMSMGVVSTKDGSSERRLMYSAMRALLKAKGYVNRDRIISNVSFDPETGMASVPLLVPHLKDRIVQCTNPDDEGRYGSLALMNFDIVHFSEWIRGLGSDKAFDVLNNLVEWWKSQRDSFGFVARDNNRDGILTSLFSREGPEYLKEKVVQTAHEYLGRLRGVPLYSGLKKVEFDFAVGGVVYDPMRVKAVPKPRFLLYSAEVMVNKAADLDERVAVDFFDGYVPAQLVPSYDISESACKDIEG